MANVGTAAAGKTLIGQGVLAQSSFASIGTLSGLTNHGVILGQGNSAFVATAAATNGQVLLGSTGADPSFGTITSSDGSLTFVAGPGTLNINVSGGTTVGKTITGNDLVPLSPTGGNWNIIGTGSTTSTGAGSTLTMQLTGLTNHAVLVGAGTATITKLTVGTNGQLLIGATAADPAFATLGINANGNTVAGANTLTVNPYNCAKWIVDRTANIGTHTTIAGALTAASSGETIFVRPGTYTENLTLKAGVNITAFSCDGIGPNVTIVGKATLTAAGTVCISGIQLQTNSDFVISVTGAAASKVRLEMCNLNMTNSTPLQLTSSDAASEIKLYNCTGDTATTGIALYSHTGAGLIEIEQCDFRNTGASVTASNNSAGAVQILYTPVRTPFTTSSTGAINFEYCDINTSATNTGCIVTAGTGTLGISDCILSSGSASCVSVGAGTVGAMSFCQVASSNTNAIAGAGTLTYSNIYFTSSSTKISTTTQTGGVGQGGVTQAPSAGFIGEQIRSAVAAGAAVSLTTATTANVTSISLTAGIWDVSCVIQFACNAATTVVNFIGGISATSATLAANYGDDTTFYQAAGLTTIAQFALAGIPSLRVTLTATTTYYLVVQSTFAVNACTAYGRISGTRVG